MNHLIIISIGMFFFLSSAGGFSRQWNTSMSNSNADENGPMEVSWKSPGQAASHEQYILDLQYEKARIELDTTENEVQDQVIETNTSSDSFEEPTYNINN
jgi:predicted dehydrogenase